MADYHRRRLIRHGVEPEEADLLSRAIDLARKKSAGASLDSSALLTVSRTLARSSEDQSYRRHHRMVMAELARVSDAEAAFGDLPDGVREQHSAFCYEMFKGNQTRFLDRHPDETPEEFIDRPRKATLNITQLVIYILSKLYHRAPVRELEDTTDPVVADVLGEVWSELFNLTMLEADRYTRLVGTVAIRPFYDPTVPGGIRPWVFLSHQLRVIPDPVRPWQAAAVIERVRPFAKTCQATIWTAHSFMAVRGNRFHYEPHGLGRIPHVWMKDRLSFTSFFVEGRGRILCDPNAILNNDLTDLEEVKQLQGFAVTEIINPDEDDVRVGPRQAFVFRPKSKDDLFGVRFVNPGAPIAELRRDIAEQISSILQVNRVPEAALGAQIGRRSLSGRAIQEAMQPIEDDLEERGRLMVPVEHDYADSALRILREHQPGFTYDPEQQRPEFQVNYAELEHPLDTKDQISRDEFDIAQGVITPAVVIRREDPDGYPTHEDAVVQWRKNLEEMRAAGFEPADDEPEPQRAAYGPQNGNGAGEDEDLLAALEGAGLVVVEDEDAAPARRW